MDVSFISILKILPASRPSLPARRPGGPHQAAVRGAAAQVGKGGIIRDPAVRAEVLDRVVRGAEESGFVLGGLVRCSTRGRKGNIEFFARFSRKGAGPGPEALAALIKEVDADE